MSRLKELSAAAEDEEQALGTDVIAYAERMSKLRIGEEGVVALWKGLAPALVRQVMIAPGSRS